MDSEDQQIILRSNVVVAQLKVLRQDGSSVVCYICLGRDRRLRPKPITILLQGSGGNSVFYRREGKLHTTALLFYQFQEMVEDRHIVCVEKRGVKLDDSVDHRGFGACVSQEYVEYATREHRIGDVCRVIDHLLKRGLYDGSEFLLIGSSEGADVAAGVASINRNVTHLALFPCSAGHGLFDSLVDLRKQFKEGKISEKEFLDEYDRFVLSFRDIRENPDAIDKQFYGHSYRRWASYCFGQSLEDLLKVEIPIFLGVGTLDGAAIGTDLVIAEFVKERKANLTYRNFVNYDHGFFEHQGDKAENRHKQVLSDLLRWVRETRS